MSNIINNSDVKVVPKTLIDYAHVMKETLIKSVFDFILQHHVVLQKVIGNTPNPTPEYISFYKSFYGESIETPQFTWMRIAIAVYGKDNNGTLGIDKVLNAYYVLSTGIHNIPNAPYDFSNEVNKLDSKNQTDELEFIINIPKLGAGILPFDMPTLRSRASLFIFDIDDTLCESMGACQQ